MTKVKDDSGHEHGADGKFTSSGGGSSSGGDESGDGKSNIKHPIPSDDMADHDIDDDSGGPQIKTPDGKIAVVHFTDRDDFQPEDITPGGMSENGTFFYPAPETEEQLDDLKHQWAGRTPVFMEIPADAVRIENSFTAYEAGNRFAQHELFATPDKLKDVREISQESAHWRAKNEYSQWYGSEED